MNVVATAESVDEQLVFGEVREQAQLDLRVVGGEQNTALFGDEGGANLAAKFGANGNVLQVRISRREAAGGGIRLIESRVEASGIFAAKHRQRIDVGRLQLGELAVFEHQARDFVFSR